MRAARRSGLRDFDAVPIVESAGAAHQRPDLHPAGVAGLRCRLCGSAALRSFVDLGATPPCELLLTVEALDKILEGSSR